VIDADSAQEWPHGDLAKAILFLLLAWLPAAVWCVHGLPDLIKAWQMHLWVQTPCRVVSTEPVAYLWGAQWQDAVPGITLYGTAVAYRYEFGGNQYSANRYAASWSYARIGRVTPEEALAQFPPGRELICFVNPGNPAEAVLDPYFTHWQVDAMMEIPPLLLVIGILAPAHFFRERRRERVNGASPPAGVRVERGPGEALRITSRCCLPAIVIVMLVLAPIILLVARNWAQDSDFDLHGATIAFGPRPALELLPFLILPLLLLGILAYLLFCRYTITLAADGGTVFFGIGQRGWTRRFACDRDTVCRVEAKYMLRSLATQWLIAIATNDRKLEFGTALRGDIREFIASAIMAHLRPGLRRATSPG
jgi:hypothetical protein